MSRLRYGRSGSAVWISHLDMMRLFQRAFARAGIRIRHSAGFNPHALISIALPMSVGTASVCEVLDFSVESGCDDLGSLPARLNACLPEGVRVFEAYESDRKIRELRRLRARVTLTFDAGAPAGAREQIEALFAREEIIVLKKKKKEGFVPENIRPMIVSMDVTQPDRTHIALEAVVCALEPSLNPEYLLRALENELPDLKPDGTAICRLEVYDENLNIFR